MTRICCKCKEEKNLSTENFSRNRTNPKHKGFQAKCKPCSQADSTAYYRKCKAENDGIPPYRHKAREYSLRHAYGLKPEDVPDNCQVCGSTEKICVDHSHESGLQRGFLCNACNLTLGFAEDDPNRLRALADYLENECR